MSARLEETLPRPPCSQSAALFTVPGASVSNISAGDRSSNSTEGIDTDAVKKVEMISSVFDKNARSPFYANS